MVNYWKKTTLSKPLAQVKIFSNKIRRPKTKPKVEKIWLLSKAQVIGHSLTWSRDKCEIASKRNVWHDHTGLIGSRSFQNYAFKGWLSLETIKLWVLVLTFFFNDLDYKSDIEQQFHINEKSARRCPERNRERIALDFL